MIDCKRILWKGNKGINSELYYSNLFEKNFLAKVQKYFVKKEKERKKSYFSRIFQASSLSKLI